MCVLTGTLQISSSIEEALFDCFNVERLCKEQVHAMMYARPFRELGSDQVESLMAGYLKAKAGMLQNYYDTQIRQNAAIRPLAGAWNGKGEVPLTFGVYSDGTDGDKGSVAGGKEDKSGGAPPLGCDSPPVKGMDAVPAPRPPITTVTTSSRLQPAGVKGVEGDTLFDAAGGPASFMRHLVGDFEWSLRVDMAAVCRLISRLNGHITYEGSFAHFSYALLTTNQLASTSARLLLLTPCPSSLPLHTTGMISATVPTSSHPPTSPLRPCAPPISSSPTQAAQCYVARVRSTPSASKRSTA